MDQPKHDQLAPIPLARLTGALVASCVAGVGVALLSTSSSGGEVASAAGPASLGAGVVGLSGLGALGVLRSIAGSPGANIGTACLAFSSTRLLGSLGGMLLVSMILHPAREPFAYAFLVAALAALVLETIILRRWSGSALSTPASSGASLP